MSNVTVYTNGAAARLIRAQANLSAMDNVRNGRPVLRTGVDLIEIERIRKAIDRHGDRFLGRIFTPYELAQSCGRLESLAGKFAAKEAAAKALGTGIWRNGIGWLDFEVRKDTASGAPELLLHNSAAQRAGGLGLGLWSLSISHDRSRAVAFVVAMGTTTPSVTS